MNPSRSFRLSMYLPLAIATAALGYAEGSLLPEVGVFALFVLGALVWLYRRDSNLRELSDVEFNRLGAGIGVAVVLWAGVRIVREVQTGEFTTLGWTAFIVALVAPVLLAAMCALLLRREKKPGDYWFMQAAGLAAIIFAGAMAEQTVLIVLTALYALSMVWFLAEFHRACLPLAGGMERFQVSRAALRLGSAALLALPLFLLTPRSPFDKLEFIQSRIEIGYAADQMIDLTQTGELKENPETAFEVSATYPNGRPKEDLPADQRWRGAVLVTYSGGTWKRDMQLQFPTRPSINLSTNNWSPPNLGEGSFKLAFTVPGKLRSTFLLDPVQWENWEPSPVADTRVPESPQAWLPYIDGRIFGPRPSARADERELRYEQHARPPAEPDLSPAYIPSSSEVSSVLLVNLLPGIKDHTDRVVNELVAAGKLPRGVAKLNEARLVPEPRYHEAVARALRDHLSERTDLSYTTNLKRANRDIDPVEDFLFHSKAGHCERFATALVLMLRSQGIPAVLVLGFKGCEHAGGGKYIVRQEHAHAWAEALIPRPNPGRRPSFHYHWLSLDASPIQERSTAASNSSDGLNLAEFERFIFRYTPEERERALKVIIGRGWALGACLVAVAFLGWRAARWRRGAGTAAPGATAWYQRLVSALALRGLVPDAGETAREFAVRAFGSLPATLADVPTKWVELHYRERFGSESIDPSERRELERRLDELGRPTEIER